MRHGKKIHKLERPKAHREALISNLATALITHKRITTTESKAKALKPVIDRLVTTAKRNTVSARRLAAKTIKSRDILKKLFNEIAPEMMDRNSGYSRIMRIGQRKGDGANLVMIELVSVAKAMEAESGKKGKSKSKAPKSKATKKAAGKKEPKAAAKEPAEAAEPVVEEATEADATPDVDEANDSSEDTETKPES